MVKAAETFLFWVRLLWVATILWQLVTGNWSGAAVSSVLLLLVSATLAFAHRREDRKETV